MKYKLLKNYSKGGFVCYVPSTYFKERNVEDCLFEELVKILEKRVTKEAGKTNNCFDLFRPLFMHSPDSLRENLVQDLDISYSLREQVSVYCVRGAVLSMDIMNMLCPVCFRSSIWFV